MSCAPHRLSAVSGLTRCGVLAMGQRLFKSDARLSGSNYTPITQQTLYAEDGIGSTVLGQYGNRRSTNSAAPAGELDSTEVIYLPTASGPMPIAAQINGRLYAIDSDHLNTPRRLTNQQGQVAWQWLITGFGETAPTQGAQGYAQPDISSVKSYAEAVSFDLRYPGQQWDEETGLSYNLHRYYDAATGRYTQADPIGLDGGWNRYSYVEGNPLSFTDPDGLQRMPGYTRPNNARDAAGYHDPRGNFVCEQWNCPANSGACSRNDLKRPSDFLPAATSANVADAPSGCTCTRLGYRPDWSPPTPEERDLGDAYNNYKEAKPMFPRFKNATGGLPLWYYQHQRTHLEVCGWDSKCSPSIGQCRCSAESERRILCLFGSAPGAKFGRPLGDGARLPSNPIESDRWQWNRSAFELDGNANDYPKQSGRKHVVRCVE